MYRFCLSILLFFIFETHSYATEFSKVVRVSDVPNPAKYCGCDRQFSEKCEDEIKKNKPCFMSWESANNYCSEYFNGLPSITELVTALNQKDVRKKNPNNSDYKILPGKYFRHSHSHDDNSSHDMYMDKGRHSDHCGGSTSNSHSHWRFGEHKHKHRHRKIESFYKTDPTSYNPNKATKYLEEYSNSNVQVLSSTWYLPEHELTCGLYTDGYIYTFVPNSHKKHIADGSVQPASPYVKGYSFLTICKK